MKNEYRQNDRLTTKRFALVALALGAFAMGGCESPDYDDGTIINELLLPTDTLLNLACADAGI